MKYSMILTVMYLAVSWGISQSVKSKYWRSIVFVYIESSFICLISLLSTAYVTWNIKNTNTIHARKGSYVEFGEENEEEKEANENEEIKAQKVELDIRAIHSLGMERAVDTKVPTDDLMKKLLEDEFAFGLVFFFLSSCIFFVVLSVIVRIKTCALLMSSDLCLSFFAVWALFCPPSHSLWLSLLLIECIECIIVLIRTSVRGGTFPRGLNN